MREEPGDLFAYAADAIVIPVNWMTKRNGMAVMGAGVAKMAADRWPWLPRSLGHQIARSGSPSVICFQATTPDSRLVYLLLVPTKHDWRKPSTAPLVELGVRTMVDLVNRHDWGTVALPRIGCGLGGLSWQDCVQPMLAQHLDDRFVVLTPPTTTGAEGKEGQG